MRVLVRILIALDLLALVPALVSLIPAGMLFDGGYTTKAWIGFAVMAAVPAALIIGLLYAVRFQRQDELRFAVLSGLAPLMFAVLAMAVLASV